MDFQHIFYVKIKTFSEKRMNFQQSK